MPSDRTLSVCMIAKDESAVLGRCLRSIAPVADEIIVVDTGSQDNTENIAVECGAKVFTHTWNRDFAAARNVSIEHAVGTWILWLDADDVVPFESLSGISELKKREPDRVFGMVVRNQKPGGIGSEFIQARMFPNRSELRFEGNVHEQIMPSALRMGISLENTPVVIEHHGYVNPAEMRLKARRNLDIMLDRYSQHEPEPIPAIEIADSYTILEDFETAANWYQHVLDIRGCREQFPAIAGQAHVGLGNIALKAARYVSAIEEFQAAHETTPERTDALYGLAVAYELHGTPENAVKELRRIVEMPYAPLQVGVDYRQTEIKAFMRLIRLTWECGRTEELEDLVEPALKKHGDRPEIQNFCGIAAYRLGKLMDALHCFEKSLELVVEGNIDAYLGLCTIYLKVGRTDAVVRTLEGIHDRFSENPRYRAFLELRGMSRLSEQSGTGEFMDRVNEEKEYIQRMWG